MTEHERSRYSKRRLEIKRKRELRQKLMNRLGALAFTGILALAIGYFCRHLLMQRAIGEVRAAAETTMVPGESLASAADAQAGPGTETASEWAETELSDLQLFYIVYVHGNGWNMPHRNNSFCMASADEYVTAMNIRVDNQPPGMTGTLEYSVNVSGRGWQEWTGNNETAGFTDGDQPVEAFRARLSGQLAENYNIYYSVLQDNVWTDWVKNGEEAGQSAAGKRVDGIRVSSIKKADEGKVFPGGVDPSRPMVALTYDDGPNREVTPRILETLERNGARATFFMVGSRVPGNGDIVRQMKEQGCEVANHTLDHVNMKRVDVAEYVRQVRSVNELVFDASGVTPVLLRPCEGAVNAAGLQAISSLGMASMMWNVDTLDWKYRDADRIRDEVLNNVKDGDIVLMHDLYGTTADASEMIIPELISQGYQLVTVSEMASYRGGLLPGKNYGAFRARD